MNELEKTTGELGVISIVLPNKNEMQLGKKIIFKIYFFDDKLMMLYKELKKVIARMGFGFQFPLPHQINPVQDHRTGL